MGAQKLLDDPCDRSRVWRLVLSGLLLATLASCCRAPLELRGPAMGTTYTVAVPRLPQAVARADVEAAVSAVLREADQHLSGWNGSSELVRVNDSRTTDWQPISPQLLEVLRESAAVSRASGGAFDVTVGPLVRAWGFGAGAAEDAPAPSQPVLDALRATIGHERLELREQPPALRKAVPVLTLDLDGIAPGWAVDRIAGRLESLGVADYLVELGGEVRARGRSPAGRPWRVAIERPVSGQRRPLALIELDAQGVSTSGDYRDYREIGGRRVSHTIDPRTGRPVEHSLAEVTVVHASVAVADAWATALMVLGPDEGMALARRQGLAALFVTRGATADQFAESATPQFERLRLRTDARL
jgi:thiamine biosynthesis lipoprotein